MNDTLEITYQKEIDDFTIIEYATENRHLYQLHYQHEDEDYTYSFGSWGMEREDITADDCLLCCQAMMWFDCTVSFNSFATNLQYTKDHLIWSEDDVL